MSKTNSLFTMSVLSVACLSGMTHNAGAVVSDNAVTDSIQNYPVASSVSQSSFVPAANAQGQNRYIIKLESPAVARFSGNQKFAAIPRNKKNRIDSKSDAAKNYKAHLINQQNNMLSAVSNTLGRNVRAVQSFQMAYNGVAVYLTEREAKSIANVSNISRVILDRDYYVDTDAGPALIGANNLWGVDGAPPTDQIFHNGFEVQVQGEFGEGIVIGTLDTGLNFDHPSFAQVGGDGYIHINPLGSGNYLGVCDSSNANQYIASYTCNDKLIGGYDFVNGLEPNDGFDMPGPEDENGHGSHTASTSGGNMLANATYSGTKNIGVSGVAPHATVIIFDTCYNDLEGNGTCPGVSSISAVDQAISDGLVDVINFSIGGGNFPWLDPVSEAFLNATASGIFVATSAGNSGPGAATVGHVEPWTMSSGASTHNRSFESWLSITGPTIDTTVENLTYYPSTGPGLTGDISSGITYAGDLDSNNFEACNSFAANSFDNQIALVSRGGCSFADKVANVTAAGANSMVLRNNVDEVIIMNVGEGTTIPSFSLTQSDGDALIAYVQANMNSTAVIKTPVADLRQADVMAGFSSRGPSPYEYNKPDVTAPGVDILAAYHDTDEVNVGTEAEYNAISGTSMASPHTAGAAALLAGLKPGWSAPEIKSALMMTSKSTGITKEDAVTVADPYDRGAGRIQVDIASQAGLVMDESAHNFALADPDNGGDVTTLNVPNLTDNFCDGTCTFDRSFRSVASETVTYDVSLSGMTGVVSPASFTLAPGQFTQLNIEVDGAALPEGVVSFGELIIEPTVMTLPTLHLPMVITGYPFQPEIDVTPTSLAASVDVGLTTTANLNVANILPDAEGDLNWTLGSNEFDSVIVNQFDASIGSGFSSGYFPLYPAGVYQADDFVLTKDTKLSELFFRGFSNGGPIENSITSVVVEIYADDSGVPAGNTIDGIVLPLFALDLPVNDVNLDLTDNNIRVDITGANGGNTLDLTAGTYWVSVYTVNLATTAYNAAEIWNWFGAGTVVNGATAQIISDLYSGADTWSSLVDFLGGATILEQLSFSAAETNACGASWLSADINGDTLTPGSESNLTVTFDSTGLAVGEYTAFLCVDSNDLDEPQVVVPVTMTVTVP